MTQIGYARKKKELSAIAVLVSVGWGLLSGLLIYFSPAILENVDAWFYDAKLHLASPPETDPEIIHADVDDKAIRQSGRLWPWDRSIHAQVVERLAQFGAKAIVFDILYSNPGPTEDGDQAFFGWIKKVGNVVSSVAPGLTERDDEKLDYGTDKSRADALYDKAWVLHLPQEVKLFKVSSAKDSFLPALPIIRNSSTVGHISAMPDRDGVYRRVPLLVKLEDRCIPALSLAALSVSQGGAPEQLISVKKREVRVKIADEVIRIPVDRDGRMLIHWGKIWDSFRHYSVADLLSEEPDKARESRYKNKIVIIGVTATGTTDMGITPVEVHTPLSRIHSHALNTILMHNFITQIEPFPYMVLCAVVLATVFCIGAAALRLKSAIIVAILICLISVALSVICFIGFSCEVPISEFLFIFGPAAVASLVVRASTMEFRAARASRAVERYLSPERLESIIDGTAELDLSTKRLELTMLFVDIEGFSTISEMVAVEHINNFLNDFLESMTQAVFEYHGTVDKFLGDGLLAFFGDPVPLDNHAEAAVNSALKMQRYMSELNTRWAGLGISEIAQGLRIRIGLNTGLVVVGNIGSNWRMEYTVVGSAVNIASRLQSLAPPGGIIMTSRTRALLKNEIKCEGPDTVRVKGIDKTIEVYRIYPHHIL